MQAAKSFIRHMFADAEVPYAKKLCALTVYLLSKGLFHIGTWGQLGGGTANKIHKAIMQLYRSVGGETWSETGGDQLCDADVPAKHELVAPHILVMLARLQLFGRMSIKAPEYIV